MDRPKRTIHINRKTESLCVFMGLDDRGLLWAVEIWGNGLVGALYLNINLIVPQA